MHMTKFRTIFALSLMLIAASAADARGRKFSCPLPDKRACMSVEQVYKSTNDGAQLDETGAPVVVVQQAPQPQRPIEAVGGAPVAVPNRCCQPTVTAVSVKGDTLAVASPVVVPASNRVVPVQNEMVVRTAREEPFRTPAKVMRIYVASWEDESGDLHMGGYLFSEIEPRKWSVGVSQRNTSDGYRLLTLSQPSRDAAQDAKTDKSDATAQVSRSE